MKNLIVKSILLSMLLLNIMSAEVKLRGLKGLRETCGDDCGCERRPPSCELQGVTGNQGPVGDTGAVGEVGFPGFEGAPGAEGDTGLQGPNGATGAEGETGPIGPDGNEGPTGIPGPPAAEGDTGETGPTGPQGPVGEDGPTGGPGASCVCSAPVIFTRNSLSKFKLKTSNTSTFTNVDSALDIAIVGPGTALAWANGGYNLPDKCNAAFELDFVFEDASNVIEFFSGTAAGALGNHPGSSYTAGKDCKLYVPLGFGQFVRLDAEPYVIHLFGRGNNNVEFKDLGVQVVFFPDCAVVPA
jgi:hypothetical protein